MTIEERVEALERLVTDLRDRLARREVRHSMARTLTCPACAGGTFLVVHAVKDARDSNLINFSLNPRESMWVGVKEGDPVQVYVCKACKLVEWYATADLAADGVNIVEVRRPDDGAPPSGKPYR